MPWNWYRRTIVRDTYLIELQDSVLAATVGLLFIFNSITQSGLYERYEQIYANMSFLPMWFWGCAYFTLGALHLAILQVRNVRWLRKQVALADIGAWVFLSTCTLSSSMFRISGYLYLVFAMFAFQSFVRIQTYDSSLHRNNADIIT